MKQSERLKAQQTLLQSMQVEALWKITKIDLDKTVREACNLILSGDYFFFPSHQTTTTTREGKSSLLLNQQQRQDDDDGWISSSTGKTIYAKEARIKAAEAMKIIGNVMVQRSKCETSWKD